MRSFYALPLLASLTACAPAFADVTLQGLAGGLDYRGGGRSGRGARRKEGFEALAQGAAFGI